MSLDPSFIKETPTYLIQGNPDSVLKDAFTEDLVIVKNVLPPNFKDDLFTLKFIEETYCCEGKNLKIDVIEQDPNFWGFTKNK